MQLYTPILLQPTIEMEQNKTDTLVLESPYSIELSPDRKYLLVAYYQTPIYRYSHLAKYVMLDVATKEEHLLISDAKTYENKPTSLTVWGAVENSMFYVVDNNIYYKSGVTSNATKLTHDGYERVIYNGVPDWVYEEEVLSSNKALWPSPDGKKLAFAKFNDTVVQDILIPFYGTAEQYTHFQYPRISQIRYPKAGTRNPIVTLHLIDLNNITQINKLKVPSALESEEPILASVEWATDNVVVAVWMNRIQNNAIITAYDVSTTNFSIITSLAQPNGWLDLFVPPIFSNDGSQFLLRFSQDQGDSLGSYRHLTLFNAKNGVRQKALTKGTFEVKRILGWDEDNNLVYYEAPEANDPSTQHVYSVSTLTGEINCISCNVKTTRKQSACLYNTAIFSKDYSNYVLQCEGPDVPEIYVYSTNGTKLLTWDDNEEVAELTNEKLIPTIETFPVQLDNNFTAYVQLKLPANLDRSAVNKYPLLVNVYGGPDSYAVTQRFNLDWGSVVTSNKSIIYASIDGRGSSLKGDKSLFQIYRNIGNVEVFDQLNVTKYIIKQYPFIDASKTAIWGWSYGGYVAGMALGKDFYFDNDLEGTFKCGISVAPVTDWKLYDSIYTERYMGLPTDDENLLNYQYSNLLKWYLNIKNKEYLLIHGSFDDNVHYQQSMFLAKLLEAKDILFRQQSYTDENHSLVSVRPHLFHTMENFLDDCFSAKQ